MRRTVTALALMGALLAALPGPPAHAATKVAKASTIKLVSPMRVKVGRTITIRGTSFSSSRRRNTIIFRSPSKRTAFAKPRRAGHRKLVVRVPASIERLLTNKDAKGVGSPTRFGLRVLVGRKYGKASKRRNSPMVVSSLRGGAPATCGQGSDFDGDLLSNALEASIKTDPCNKDSDGDGVEDGFEHESALDVNQRAVPYPRKRPYPNALDASDAYDDYDGDGLTMMTEFRAWAEPAASPPPSGLLAYSDSLDAPAFGGPYGTVPRFGNHSLPLNYSDGDQTTVDVRPGHPEWSDSRDDTSGHLTDDERDVDGDGIANMDESHNRGAFDENDAVGGPFNGGESFRFMSISYYTALPGDGCDVYEYTPLFPRPMLQPSYLDWDSDGDGVWDGNDDQDGDAVSNVDEIKRPWQDCGDGDGVVIPTPIEGARNGAAVLRNPYNPCLPYRSEVCGRYGPR